jgi:hypothetical protein
MRTLAVVVVGVLVLLVGGACGGGKSAEDDVRAAWSDAAHAIADGNATAFCALVSDEGKREIEQRAGMECEDAVRVLASRLGAADKDTVRGAEITKVEVDGDEATVIYESSSALARVGLTGRTTMRKVDGRWLLRGV